MFKEYCKNCNIEIVFKRKCDHSRFLNGDLFLCLKCYKKHHYYKNHTNTLSIKKKWRDNNKEKQTEYWYKNKKRIQNNFKNWYKSNYSKIVEYRNLPHIKLAKKNTDHIRRTKCINKINKQDLELLYFNTNICKYCNRIMKDNKNDYDLYKTIDHRIPLIRGGSHEISNIDIICFHCNVSKNNKTDEEYESTISNNEGAARIGKINICQEVG